jgi:hypothetical protein
VWFGCLDFGQQHRQDAVVVGRFDLLGRDRCRQRKDPLKRSVRPLIPMHLLGFLLGYLLLVSLDRQQVVLDRDLHVLWFHARQLRNQADKVRLLEDVNERHPRGRGRFRGIPAIPFRHAIGLEQATHAALQPKQQIQHRIPLWLGGNVEHGVTSVGIAPRT